MLPDFFFRVAPSFIVVVSLIGGLLLLRSRSPMASGGGVALLFVCVVVLANMGYPCAHMLVTNSRDDIDFCDPKMMVTINPHLALGWLFRSP